MSVKVKQLTKIFGNQKAIDDITFEAKKSEILGFLGPNGAGKSTTMKIATCYLPPSQGTAEVCGLDVQHQSLEVRKKIGYLPEHNPLYYDMYVHEYLNFIGRLHIRSKKLLKNKVSEMIDICGLGVEQNKKIGALSKGFRQRVGLAQALIHDPEVLILDEPTTGLDPNQIDEIRSLIKNTSKDKTVLFSTHIMQEVQVMCDRVVIINKGAIVADATPAELKSHIDKIVLMIEFKEDVDHHLLESLPSVKEIEVINNKKFKLTSTGQEDFRPEIFRLATENNLTLLELKQESGSMEDIFRSLTQNKA